MQADASPQSIAARIRGILGEPDRGTIEATARRLGVCEVSLRISTDEKEPHPTVDVIIAIVRHYGVDPTWLMTGNYDPTSHRTALEDESSSSSGRIGAYVAQHLAAVEAAVAPVAPVAPVGPFAPKPPGARVAPVASEPPSQMLEAR